jgi:hypothetical protein
MAARVRQPIALRGDRSASSFTSPQGGGNAFHAQTF